MCLLFIKQLSILTVVDTGWYCVAPQSVYPTSECLGSEKPITFIAGVLHSRYTAKRANTLNLAVLYWSRITAILNWYVRNNQYISFQNNTAQLYFKLGRAELCWKFSSLPRDAYDIQRFSTKQIDQSHFLLEYL